LPLGCLIGLIDIVDCLPTSDAMFQSEAFRESTDFAFGDYDAGRFAWRLQNPRLFREPIPYTGQQGWFSVSNDVIEGREVV
jgi:hypothetical protein